LRISRHAVKSQCARGWGGWGRLSDDGARQHNLHPSEDPWGGGRPHLHGDARSNGRPDTAREYRNVTKCAKGGHKPTISQCMPGAGLSWLVAGRCRSKCQPSSRIGENPPYGMIGRVEETSASFEARSAPRLYPTAGGAMKIASLPLPTAICCICSGLQLAGAAAGQCPLLSGVSPIEPSATNFCRVHNHFAAVVG
jgi:hypothetical protein